MARTELDLDHISAVCDRLTESTPLATLNITPTHRGYAITATTRADARRVETAFARVGYRASRPEIFGNRNRVAITGWSRHHLGTRITALHETITRLHNSRDRTASAAIDHGARSTHDLSDLREALLSTPSPAISTHHNGPRRGPNVH